MTHQETIETLSKLQSEFIETGVFKPLEDFYNTVEYKKLSYLERNRGLITAHKLMAFDRCQFCYAQEYINERPRRDGKKDALIIGSALDDLVTEGEDFFANKYEVVKARNEATIKKFPNKTLLTGAQSSLIRNMLEEYRVNALFNQQPKKKIVLIRYKTFLLKIEIDDIDHELRKIVDVKTAANIVKFYKEMAKPKSNHIGRTKYLLQMTFYFWVWCLFSGEEYDAALHVTDKNKDFSRSGGWFFHRDELRGQVDRVITLLDDIAKAHESGIFFQPTDQTILYECPYYGFKGHGRPTKYF